MEKKYFLNFLSQIVKRNLVRTVMIWKNNGKLIQISEKYTKLKKYVSKILKTRHIPSIKIETSSSKRKQSSSINSTYFSTAKSDFFHERTLINRSISSIKSKPPSIPEKNSKTNIENQGKNNKNVNKSLILNTRKPKDPEEIAIVSSNSIISEINILNISNRNFNMR